MRFSRDGPRLNSGSDTDTAPNGIGTGRPCPCREPYESLRPVTVEVLPGPVYRVNGQSLTEQELQVRLRETYAARPDRVVHILGDVDLTYQQVITAMDLARGAGAKVVVVRTDRSRTRRPCPFDARYPASLRVNGDHRERYYVAAWQAGQRSWAGAE